MLHGVQGLAVLLPLLLSLFLYIYIIQYISGIYPVLEKIDDITMVMSSTKVKVQIKSRTTQSHPQPRQPTKWKIMNNIPNFDRIYHISDIHIRPLQRHQEFRDIFGKLERILQAGVAEGHPIAIITGDVFDNKTVFRPETFQLCRDLFKMIAKNMPVVVIAGNHDMMESNINRLDAITPVVDDIPNLYYLKYSGLYSCPENKTCLVVSSLYDKEFIRHEDLVNSSHFDPNIQYLSLYHGTLSGAITDIGYEAGTGKEDNDTGETTTRYRSINDFKGFDAVLLGDIHKHQLMKESPPIAYAGSLIQQNHGENIDGHGVLVWHNNEGNWTCHLETIENEYGFVDIYCQDGEWINNNVTLPTNSYARLIIKNCTETQIDIIIADLKGRVKTLNITKRQCISDKLDEFEIPPDIQRKEDELELIREQAEHDHYDANSLIELHQTYQSELDIDAKGMSTAVWRPVSITYKNMFGFGNNVVNKMLFKRGTISISAGNACGKTSIVNIILFAIFGRTPLNPSNTTYTFDIINNKQDSGFVKILLNHGGQYYLIERKTVRKNVKAVTSPILQMLNRYDFTCSIWESNIKGDKLRNCSELKRNNTDTFITDLFGDINDFSLSNLLNKESSLDLLSMTPTEQIKVLKKLFKLEIYDAYKELNKNKLSSIEREIAEKRIERKTLEPMINDCVTEELLVEKDVQIDLMTKTLDDCKSELNILQEDKINFIDTLRAYEKQVQRIDRSDLPTSKSEINLIKKELETSLLSTDTGISAETLQYHADDLQRQINNICNNISALSDIRKEAELCEELSILEDQLVSLGINATNTSESVINRNVGTLNSKVELTKTRIEDLQGRLQGRLCDTPISRSISDLKESIVPLSSNLTAIQHRLDKITDQICTNETSINIEEIQHTVSIMKNEIVRLESENRLLDQRRDTTALDLENNGDTEFLRSKLIQGIPSIKYAVTDDDYNNAVLKVDAVTDELNSLTERSFDQIIEDLNHGNHKHDSECCMLSTTLIDDVTSYLKDGDRIRDLEVSLNKFQMVEDRLREQLDINIKVDSNKKIEAKLAQINYLSNLEKITTLSESIKVADEQLKMQQITDEYHTLCAEEELHYTNQDIADQIQYIELTTELKLLQDDMNRLMEALSVAENQLVYIELNRSIALVKKNLEAHNKITEFQSRLTKLEMDKNETLTQLGLQESYDRYKYLLDMCTRLDISAANNELNECIEGVQKDLTDIEYDVTEHINRVEDIDKELTKLKEDKSILCYRYQQQETLKQRLTETDRLLIELEESVVPYKQYNIIMGNRGITSKLLFNKIKSIESYINTIIQQFTKYTIQIIYDDKRQTINMVTKNKDSHQYLSTSRLSGYEKLMLQIAFKRALNKFSYNSKSSLVIIDEALDCIDQDNFLTKLPDAMCLITQDYSNCLAISQRDISHISDSIVTITTINNCSQLAQ